MICYHCKRPYSDDEIEAKKKQKADRIRQARVEARQRGEQVGAPKVYDTKTIIDLRKTGLTIREIAKQIGSSTGPVQKAVKEFEKPS